jgi:hypothetical protein
MTFKDDYVTGEQAVNQMIQNILLMINNRSYPAEDEYDLEYAKEDVVTLNTLYQECRDAAMAFGEDVNDLPRKLKRTTRLPTLALPI